MALLLTAFLATLTAVQSAGPDDILAALAKARLDKNQIYKIRDITIRRDALSISFNRGTIAFLEPVMGKFTGAVFIGSGEIVTIPPDSTEKQQLFAFTNSPVLNEPFRSALFRFTDKTYEEIINGWENHAREDVTDEDRAQFVAWDQVLADRSVAGNFRVLSDVLATERQGMFFGELNGERLGWFQIVYDPRRLEEVAILKAYDQQKNYAVDIWTSFNQRGELRARDASVPDEKSPVDTLSLEIDATISADTQIEASTKFRFRERTDGERVLNLELSKFLRVSKVEFEDGEPVPFYQRDGLNPLVLVLPRPTKTGRESTLMISYAGEVIDKLGNGLFSVGGRGSWYPNLGPQDRAQFDLTFHFPQNYTLAATGKRIKEWEESGLRHSQWQSDGEFSVAGFVLGDFKLRTDETSAIPVHLSVSNEGRANEAMLKDARAALAYLQDNLGPYPYSQLTVAESSVTQSVNWPSLVRVSAADPNAAELSLAQEIAHQWFGNKVAVHSYRDEWMSVGLANYAGVMFLEHKYPERSRLREIMEGTRNRLLARSAAAETHEAAGPIWLGPRLSSSVNPNGYADTLYSKSTWVVHMLRMMMRKEGPDSDGPFLTMLRDFLNQYSGKTASTWDFKRVAEKHMTPAMDVRGDKILDWFFDEWVFGTGVPSYSLDYKVEPNREGFLVQGRVQQKGVSTDFIMPVPVYADDDLLGSVVVSEDEGAFKFQVKKKPTRIVLDPHWTVLRREE
jgi:hypothetical protein